MKSFKSLITVLLASCISACNSSTGDPKVGAKPSPNINDSPAKAAQQAENTFAKVGEIPLPNGYKRMSGKNDFGNWLQNLPLKKDKTVYLFDGRKKANQVAQFAVLDVPVLQGQDLQQCADAIMRLRAEHLRQAGDEIVFYDNDKTPYRYQGGDFDSYLRRVFGMCGTASLTKQMHSVTNFKLIKPGDVLIKGGFPGHAVIVMDVATNSSGETIYLLAQSYMPAQDIHLLINPNDATFSPWYKINNNDTIETPEWTFTQNQLMEW